MQARSHISLEVSDLATAIRFYSLVFRIAPTKQQKDYANYQLESPALHLALEHRPDRASGNPFQNQHFGIELFENEELLSWRNWLQAVGVPYRIEEQVTCCYAVADKFWLTDPDGHKWEFWVRINEADLMHGEALGTSTVDCCAPASAPVNAQRNIQENEATIPTVVNGAVSGALNNGDQSRFNATTPEHEQVASQSRQSSCCG